MTHAPKYGLDPSGYEHGLGPYAIRPLNNPFMLTPGDAGYPSSKAKVVIVGVDLNGFVRPYPTWTLLQYFEVANDVFGEAHVAVAF